MRTHLPTILLASFLGLLPIGGPLFAKDDHRAALRWAIVSSQQVRGKGVADLLTVELSRAPGFELVERDRLEAALAEMELASLGDAKASTERVALGNKVAADVLLLLDLKQVDLFPGGEEETKPGPAGRGNRSVEKADIVRLVVCDCRTGARIAVHSIGLEGLGPAGVAHELTERISSARKKLLEGIRYVVGVSPFLSKELSHEYDSYQQSLASLAESVFMALPGVAVVEQEEAEDIWEELSGQQDSTLRRAVPLLVDGEYSVSGSEQAGRPVFTIVLTGRFPERQTVTAEARAVAPDDLATRIGGLVEQLIANHSGWSRSSVPSGDQFAWLMERANMFSTLGAWKPAIGLRQAALLIKPREPEPRLLLISDQRMLLREMASTRYVGSGWPGPIGSRGRAERLIAIYLDQLRNMEYLIRNRLVDTTVARRILSSQGYASVQSGVRENEARAEPGTAALLAEAEQKRKEFLSSIAGALFRLPDTPAHSIRDYPLARLGDLQDVLLAKYITRIDYQKPTLADLQELRRIWVEDVPDGVGLPDVLSHVTYTINPSVSNIEKKQRYVQRNYSDNNSGITEYQWMGYLKELSMLPHRSARLSARQQLLLWHWYALDKNSPSEEVAFLKDMADSLAFELADYPVKDNRGRTYMVGGGATRCVAWTKSVGASTGTP